MRQRASQHEAHQNSSVDLVMLHDRDNIIAAASSCPEPECGSLVVEYRTAGSVRSGHPEDWEFTCSRCGIEFTVAQGELIFQSVPKQWLSANPHAA